MRGCTQAWSISKSCVVCEYGNGKGMKLIFFAAAMFTIPKENSWKTRDTIGGAISMVFALMLSTTKRCIQFMTTSDRSDLLCTNIKLSGSIRGSMISNLGLHTELISPMALQKSKLINLTSCYWNFFTSWTFSGFGLQKETKLLVALNHSPRAFCKYMVHSQ